jgi:Flp pilus assembly protein TadG
MSMRPKWLTVLEDLSRRTEGAVAPIFGLCLVGLLFSIGVAIDSARVYRATADVSYALDAAALAAAKALRLEKADDARLNEVAIQYFAANFAAGGDQEATYKNLKVEADRTRSAVKLTVDVRLPTTVGVLMGVDRFDIPASSTAIYEAKDIELSMMLDVSGSMSGTKILELHTAAADLVDILLSANKTGAKHRIAIAPFSNSVNVGSFSDAVSDPDGKKKGKGGGTTCVTERTGANAFTGKGPDGGKFGKKASSCPAGVIVPLSDDAGRLTGHINTLEARGSTAGHLGIAWAWYLLSPEWAGVWPSESEPKEYADAETQKAVIIMTDGEFNTSYEPGNGDAKVQAEKLCDNMKLEGVVVYTVGFQAPPEALPVLQHCATSASHFFSAEDGNQLRDTFQTIAKRLSALRLES